MKRTKIGFTNYFFFLSADDNLKIKNDEPKNNEGEVLKKKKTKYFNLVFIEFSMKKLC